MICPECRADNIQGEDYCWNCNRDLRGIDHAAVSAGPERGPDFIYVPLGSLPSRPAPRASVQDPVGFAVRLMQNEDTDCVLVMRDNQLAGIITPWDILHKVAGPREDLNAVTCAQMMTADPVTLHQDDDLAVAINKMSVGGFRHIPIVEDGGAMSVVTIADLYRYLAPRLV
jgi:CBS domain-containing protein